MVESAQKDIPPKGEENIVPACLTIMSSVVRNLYTKHATYKSKSKKSTNNKKGVSILIHNSLNIIDYEKYLVRLSLLFFPRI